MSTASCNESLRPNQVAGGITRLTTAGPELSLSLSLSPVAMAASKTIYVSSRKSQLAMYQTNEVIGKLQASAAIGSRWHWPRETDTSVCLSVGAVPGH